ncbi:galactose mutarotase-like [Periplaneta americana]|uniref:galactose mutarotase-like n=1 Tax=Periplaneta americana TaxID=6978 RepID=UPI0037E8BFEF
MWRCCVLWLALAAYACAEVAVREDDYGTLGAEVVKRFTFSNSNNMTVEIITYGGRITVVEVPDNRGDVQDVVLGFDNLEGYISKNDPYFGAILGRTANRIGGAKFTLDGVQYNVTANEGQNQLHGGLKGFDKMVWEPYLHDNKLTLSYVSADGEEGFPGTVLTQVTYELTSNNELIFDVTATSTKPTPINIANHAYFNLAGQDSGPDGLLQHEVTINADQYTVTDNQSIPTGELATVDGTDLDFRTPHLLGPLIQSRGGYDNNYCVNEATERDFAFVSRVVHPESGRYLEVYSNQPGVQFYTGNGLPKPGSQDPLIGKGGVEYHQYGSFSLETQDYPDAVNHPNFPSSILNPGSIYSRTTIYKFGTITAKRAKCNKVKHHH